MIKLIGGNTVDDKHSEVFRQYDLKVYNMYRARGAFLLETNQGLKLFKCFEDSENHLLYENKVKDVLVNKGFNNVDIILPNKEGGFVTADSAGTKYVIKNWFEGEECNLKELKDIYAAAKNLARIHRALEGIKEEEETSICQPHLAELFDKHNKELKRVKTYIWNKKQRNDFELTFLLIFDFFYEDAKKATALLEACNYNGFYEECLKKGLGCHGNYTYHNILVTKEGIAVTNFEKCCCGVQIMDLYQLFRKCMEKNNWDKNYGHTILSGYESVRSISKEEYHILYLMLLYPEKFWKVTNYYINNKKSWISARNIQKLTILQQQTPLKEEFLKEFFP